MSTHLGRALTTVLAVAALTSAAAAIPAAVAAPRSTGTSGTHRACAPATAGHATCFAEVRNGTLSVTGRTAFAPPTSGYGPADIKAAYQLDQTRGTGQTVAIVDAYDNPKAASNLATYRKAWGLPACTVANGCFRKVNQRGTTTPPIGDTGWGLEIALDLDAVSAACPNCKILLVEADSNSFANLGAAVNRASTLGAKIISNSYGGDESSSSASLGAAYYNHAGTAMLASSGDNGYRQVNFPAVYSKVISVGGTSLTGSGSSWTESAWSGAGSGCSAYFAKPSYQHDTLCAKRMSSDVSADADPNTGLAIYDTYGESGWLQVGGTSLASPLIAGMVALAGNAASLTTASYIYAHTSGLFDPHSGSNGSCGGTYFCTGKVGYDGPTGIGSPRGLSAL